MPDIGLSTMYSYVELIWDAPLEKTRKVKGDGGGRQMQKKKSCKANGFEKTNSVQYEEDTKKNRSCRVKKKCLLTKWFQKK